MDDPEVVQEGAACIYDIAFYDENAALVAPTAASWSLFREDGTAVLSNQSLPAASEVTVVIPGTYTKLVNQYDTGYRKLEIYASYNSSLGSGLALNGSVRFKITNLHGVS